MLFVEDSLAPAQGILRDDMTVGEKYHEGFVQCYSLSDFTAEAEGSVSRGSLPIV